MGENASICATSDICPWREDLPHTHIALSDAIERDALFCNMLKEGRS
jgi:hypothetical protein